RLVVDEEAYVVPLLEYLHRHRRYLVVHTDTHRGRLYTAGRGGVHLIESIDENDRSVQALILCPTRELAIQVEETFRKFCHFFGLRSALIIGGAPMWKQISNLRAQPHIVIGTPGRIIDHLKQKTLRLSDVAMLVLDEADRMLDMGFVFRVSATQCSFPPPCRMTS
ncbi:DEAD/DEAH box helicase, partial [Candidatus Peregrinibacteria bacterium]|nr:DEAD/DEAH box helicase [Candidatus Peregrinibacteria bacterium]